MTKSAKISNYDFDGELRAMMNNVSDAMRQDPRINVRLNEVLQRIEVTMKRGEYVPVDIVDLCRYGASDYNCSIYLTTIVNAEIKSIPCIIIELN